LKILVTGVNGQLGYELARQLADIGTVVSLDRSALDLNDLSQISTVIRDLKPQLIINPAAYTAVDKAESEPQVAQQINARAPAVMAEEAQRLGAAMIHYSTDYVFDGEKTEAYLESDIANPQSVYGRTKFEGEQAVAQLCDAHLIIRTSWVYGVHGNNFLKTILRLAAERDVLKIVADQSGAPTFARSIALATRQAITRSGTQDIHQGLADAAGIYHFCAAGNTSWYGYAQHILARARELGLELKLNADAMEPIPTEAYPLPAPRPKNSCLATAKFAQRFSYVASPWQVDVDSCLAELILKNDKA